MKIPKPIARFLLWAFNITEQDSMTLVELEQWERNWEIVQTAYNRDKNAVPVDPDKIMKLIRIARESMERIEMLITERDGAMNMARAAQRERDVCRAQLTDMQERDRS